MRTFYLSIISCLFIFPLFASAQVNFKDQTIADTVAQAKKEQKLVFSVCSAESCRYCVWMDKNVYTDPALAFKVNTHMIANKPNHLLSRLEYYSNCTSLPSMLFFDENGKLIKKFDGKRDLSQMTKIVDEVLANNCTGLDQFLDESQGTRKASVCCDGLVKNEKDGKAFCAKRGCVEKKDRDVVFQGTAKDALPCCDQSAIQYIHPKMGGANARRFGKEFKDEFKVECADADSSRSIQQTKRKSRLEKKTEPSSNSEPSNPEANQN